MKEVLPSETKALVLHGALDLRYETRPLLPPSSTEVQVGIKATGLCGSDLHYFQHGQNGNFVVRSPLVLGHESAGIVTAIPSSSTPNGLTATPGNISTSHTASSHLQIGDRVALEVGMPCRTCTYCSNGRYNLCPAMVFRSSAKTFPHADGTLQQMLNHPASMCHKLPKSVTYEQGALVEPLAVALHGVSRSLAGCGPSDSNLCGTSALVIGAGAVGLLVASALAVHGVTDVVVADISAPRLKVAEALGQNPRTGAGKPYGIRTHLLEKTPPATDTDTKMLNAGRASESIADATSTIGGFNRVFECTGLESCVQIGIFSAALGGKLMLVGMGHPVQTLNLGAAALREVDIIGVFRYANQYQRAINLFASGKLEGVAELLCTHQVGLEEGERAFEISAKGSDEDGRAAVKVLVQS